MQVRWRAIFEGAGLVLALSFVALLTFVPHLNTVDRPPTPSDPPLLRLATAGQEAIAGERQVYPYPIHVDEHLHWVFTDATIRQQKVALDTDPYTGQEYGRAGFFGLGSAVHERGFRLIVAEMQQLTGVPFLRVFEFLPTAWLTFTAFGMYAVLRPHPVAVPAAAFVALIPTTLRFLGPGFLVPIGFVLAWLPATLILAEPAKRYAGAAALLGITVVWAFFVHLIGGFAAVGLLALGGLLGGARNLRSALSLLVVAAVPVLWLYQAFTADVRGELKREEFLPTDFTYFDNLGLIGLGVWAAGAAAYTWSRREQKSMASTALVGGSVAMFALVLLGVAFDWGRYATYARWHPPMILAMSVPLAFAVTTATGWLARLLRKTVRGRALPSPVAGAVVAIAGVLAVGYLVTPGVERHLEEPYYRVMNDADWARFQYVANHVNPDYEVALVHPWKAPVLLATSGRYPHAVLFPGEPPLRGNDWDEYVRNGGTLEFYILNDVTLVVAGGKPPLPEFVDLGHEGVWGLEPDIAHEIALIRAQERSLS